MLVPVGPFRKIPCGGGVLPNIINPTSLPGLELYLDSRLGLTGAHNSVVQPWPDQSGHGRDAGNDASNSNSGKMLLQTTSNLSPGGQHSVLFNGANAPGAAVGINSQPNPWPAVTAGWTFYFAGNLMGQVSGTAVQLLWCEPQTEQVIWAPEGGNQFYAARGGQAGADDHDTTLGYATGWQLGRLIYRANGRYGMVINGQLLNWSGGVEPTYHLNPSIYAGYTIANLSQNYVIGQHMALGAFLWYSNEHTPTQQQGVENYLRLAFGFPLLLGAP